MGNICKSNELTVNEKKRRHSGEYPKSSSDPINICGKINPITKKLYTINEIYSDDSSFEELKMFNAL